MTFSRQELVLARIQSAREYTLRLLADIPQTEWFSPIGDNITHIAWQVGHLAMAEYGLVLFRVRGRLPVDKELMSGSFRKKFSRGSTPDFDPAGNPTTEEIFGIFNAVHAQACAELPDFTDAQLDAEIDRPYSFSANNFGGLLFCADHEMLHAGQIGLARRMLGKDPLG
ncbi:DinB family protein [Lignipirellula cremea]|uniref:DinB superfamily protein n=1 Tax=Lignipirellula cremea TaxID=2528010 RepID=A0A518DT63_9BACT|nr:DinB family protein [Lignipirellula cremea]QDU95027.1 DinB superfamily protein [Lignipirellula cremea]